MTGAKKGEESAFLWVRREGREEFKIFIILTLADVVKRNLKDIFINEVKELNHDNI
ncbi:MAG: hypothetical protein ACTSWE_02415 [Promethearchaeota archaeon]